jgi:serine/threonine protein kinase
MKAKLIETKDFRSNKRRELSPAVQTRWYRSPEVILLQKKYTEQIDIYSVGMILCQLMTSSNLYDAENKYK